MEGNKKKWVIIVFLGLMALLVFIYKVYKDFSDISEAMEPKETLTSLNFESVNQSIFIKTRIWGLLGQHSRISISETKNDISNENDIDLDDRSLIYYTVKYPDSLLVFLTSMSYSEERITNRKLGDINIRIVEFKSSKNREYEERYEELGLKKIELDN